MNHKDRSNGYKKQHTHKTPITAEQYIWDPFSKNTVNMLDDILKHFEKQTQPNVTNNHNRQT